MACTVTRREMVVSKVELRDLGMFNPERTCLSGESIASSDV